MATGGGAGFVAFVSVQTFVTFVHGGFLRASIGHAGSSFLCVKERRMYARENGNVFLVRTAWRRVRRNDLSRRGTAVPVQHRDSAFLGGEKEQV